MKIWYDACTGKHIRYGVAIGRRLREAGHEFIFTTREHPDTIPLAKLLGESPIVVGKYNPASLFSRLEESAKRIIGFSKLFTENKPDIAVAHQSVELCRTAFGLGIPIILTADTPHALSVNNLTIPFAHTVVVSEALPKTFPRKYCAQRIVPFKGVDEVAWIQGYQPLNAPDLEKPLIVLRQVEHRAAYAQGKTDIARNLTEELGKLGNVQFIERYGQEGDAFGVKSEFIDSVNLIANADLVISYGGTIAREAALLGVPSIAVSDMAKTNVNVYLAKKGFPLFITTEQDVLAYAKKYVGKRFDVASKLAAFDNPADIVAELVETIIA
ncbi:MAG: DUF354 domain-containing protein [Candidatus Bathyarchaeota archaeon]|nr:DUF354 domain-containing protein [Candidatus Bathyarchaeota archaeon]